MASEWVITNPRYIRQAGKAYPEYIHAAPDHKVTVLLADDFVPSKHDHNIFPPDKAPVKPKPAHADNKRDPVRKAQDAQVSGTRAADR